MNAISANYGAGFAESCPPAPPRRPSPPQRQGGPPTNTLGSNTLSLGLQLSRATAMALTRLQLALCSGERRQALEAIDRLDTLDAELERLVARIEASRHCDTPGETDDDDDWRALSAHLADQKLALAFDKLALASGISGPDLKSAPAYPAAPGVQPSDPEQPRPDPHEDAPPLVDWHAFPAVQPTEWNPFAHRAFTVVFGVVLALVVTAILAAAAVTMGGW